MFQEKGKRWGANKAVKKFMDAGKFKNLEQLGDMRLTNRSSSEDVELFYAEAASIVYYMNVELGKFRFYKFCRQMRELRSFERAFLDTYPRFKSIKDLNDAWVDYLER